MQPSSDNLVLLWFRSKVFSKVSHLEVGAGWKGQEQAQLGRAHPHSSSCLSAPLSGCRAAVVSNLPMRQAFCHAISALNLLTMDWNFWDWVKINSSSFKSSYSAWKYSVPATGKWSMLALGWTMLVLSRQFPQRHSICSVSCAPTSSTGQEVWFLVLGLVVLVVYRTQEVIWNQKQDNELGT